MKKSPKIRKQAQAYPFTVPPAVLASNDDNGAR